MQHHRHAVMDLGHQGVGIRRDNGKRGDRAALGIVYGAPDTRKGKRLPGFQGDPIGHLACTETLPLVESIRQHQAALAAKGLLEEGFRRHRLRPGIDDRFDVAASVGPFGQKSPGTDGDGVRVCTEDRGQPLRRRGVIAGGHQADRALRMKPSFQGRRVGANRISAAHIPSWQSFA
jgi:hypothetical protein